MKTKLFLLTAVFGFVSFLNAQKPFKDLGLDDEVEVLTLSDGRYLEHFTNDTLRQIGSVIFNTVTNTVEYFILDEDLEKLNGINRSREVSRFLSVDGMLKSFPWYTPYQFAGNKPVWAIDLDGAEEYIYTYLVADQLGRTILINKSYNVGTRYNTTTCTHEQYNLKTGKVFDPKECGTVQHQYKAYWNTSGFEPYNGSNNPNNLIDVSWKRDYQGNLVLGEGDIVAPYNDNYFESTYIGPNNPKSESGGVDYRREPQDLMDAAAMEHDMSYDRKNAAGPLGTAKQSTIDADRQLVAMANMVIKYYGTKMKDPYTNQPISEETYNRAKQVRAAFGLILGTKVYEWPWEKSIYWEPEEE